MTLDTVPPEAAHFTMRIIPFKGIFYNTSLVNLADVVTLPYDKISPEKRTQYTLRSSYNMVHAILPSSYSEADRLLKEWLKKQVLIEDKTPSIYIYEQKYEYPKGTPKSRIGFVALLELQPFGKTTIMPHERTFPKIKEDRLCLLRASKMNLGQIFILYNDPHNKIGGLLSETSKYPAVCEFSDDDGIIHRLWKIIDEKIIASIQKGMEDKSLFIADGHHRYESSLMYKEEEQEKTGKWTGREGFNYCMATFVNVDNPGLVILPTHRVLKENRGIRPAWLLGELEKYFIVETTVIPDHELLQGWLESIKRTSHTFGLYLGGDNYYTLKLKTSTNLEDVLGINRPRAWLYLDVNILHLLILKYTMDIDTHKTQDEQDILYIRDASAAIDWVRDNHTGAAFILNPTKIEEIKEIVEMGNVMPHKSTDFYPKLYSGFVMRKLEENTPPRPLCSRIGYTNNSAA